MIVNKTELSDFVGYSLRTITEWQNRGMPVEEYGDKGRAGKYDTHKVVRWLRDGAGDPNAGGVLDANGEKARLTKEQADRQEMENRVRRGELVEAASIQRKWHDVAGAAVARIHGVPRQVAPLCAAVESPPEVEEIVAKAVDEALRELRETVDED